VSYWSGVAHRSLPALLVGVVAGVAALAMGGWGAALFVGVPTALAAMLLPVRQTPEQPPAGTPPQA
jgi:hypothetical protein